MDTTSTVAIASTSSLTSTVIAPTTSTVTSTMATSISPTTSFVTSWNTSGITVAGVTDVPGVTANKFNHPFCLVLDSSRALYVTDQPNQRVQKWVVNASTGVTVAGQSNASTGITLKYLSYPSDLALDAKGNLFIVDGGNHRVVHWTMNATSATLVAGNGSAGSGNNQLSSPIGLAIDINVSTLYISDAGNHRIMKYLANATSGTVVAGGYGAGTNSSQLNNPRGIYFESSTNSLIIANNGAHNIVRWVLGATSWTLLAGSSTGLYGSTSTLLYNPSDVTLDATGNMYVSDEGNQRIQLFLAGQSSGQTIIGVTGISGNTSQLLNTPSSFALDSQLNIYIVDYGNYRVQKFAHY
ncbi:unnamed protein product [Adineta steineri]|uniref:NHL repeat containing protein n=1 Tax=Adineta steineri TaxID=433720 RepID=A0A819J6E7_9BILA|nr:unnamed protein product [Adineta steineri]CAF3925376.1 unnamed protein product [Adineta steineri]